MIRLIARPIRAAKKVIRGRRNAASAQPARSPSSARAARDRHLWEPTFGRLERHPKDEWQMADPMPLPQVTLQAMRGVIRALCPPPPAPSGPEVHAKVEDYARRAMQYMHPLFAVSMVAVMHVLDLSPVWMGKDVRRLQDLEHERASEILYAVADTGLGAQLVFAARMTVLSMYFDLEEVHEALGYRPAAFMRERIALRKRLLAGKKPTDKDIIGPNSEVAA